jgi:GxxExxY protein
MLHQELTSEIINAFYAVYNQLGYGFLEKVYENALAHELDKRGLKVQQQVPIKVTFDRIVVGEYFADLLVDNRVILELKAAETIVDGHKAQLLNYLKATDIEVGLILNFGPKPTFERKVFTQKNKKRNPRKSV